MSDPRLCLALDGCTPEAAQHWIRRTSSTFSTYKIGLELFCAGGPELVRACYAVGAREIFLDLKLHDIPRTVARAIQALDLPGVRWLTVHAAGGGEMLAEAQACAGKMGIGLLAVTVLTSMDAPGAAQAGLVDLPEAVLRRTRLAAAAGLAGVVSSVAEVPEIKDKFPALCCVTPGIRWADGPAHDQRRIADPATAVAAGADMLVIGRMLTEAPDYEAALRRLVAEME